VPAERIEENDGLPIETGNPLLKRLEPDTAKARHLTGVEEPDEYRVNGDAVAVVGAGRTAGSDSRCTYGVDSRSSSRRCNQFRKTKSIVLDSQTLASGSLLHRELALVTAIDQHSLRMDEHAIPAHPGAMRDVYEV
jgi:hypothetical protein